MLKIRWNGTPISQSRPRFYNGHAYEEPRLKEYKRDIRQSILATLPRSRASELPFTETISVRITIYKKCKIKSRRYGDLDNLAKAVLDALNGYVWLDDSLIEELTLKKVESVEEGVEIIVNL